MLAEKRHPVERQFMYGFTAYQLGILSVLGIVFWFLGATCVRIGAQFGAFGSVNSGFSFAVGLVICWVSVWIITKVAVLTSDQIVPAVSLGLGVATFLDGIAITWFSALYGTDPQQIALGAAWILWGVFGFIAAAFGEAYRRRAAHH